MVSIDGQSDFCIETLHKSIKLRKNTIVYISIYIYIYIYIYVSVENCFAL